MEHTVHIITLKEQPSDRAYWHKQPEVARLAAIEFLRQQFMDPHMLSKDFKEIVGWLD